MARSDAAKLIEIFVGAIVQAVPNQAGAAIDDFTDFVGEIVVQLAMQVVQPDIYAAPRKRNQYANALIAMATIISMTQ